MLDSGQLTWWDDSLENRFMHVLCNDRVFDLQPEFTRACHCGPAKLQEEELVTVTTPPDHVQLQQTNNNTLHAQLTHTVGLQHSQQPDLILSSTVQYPIHTTFIFEATCIIVWMPLSSHASVTGGMVFHQILLQVLVAKIYVQLQTACICKFWHISWEITILGVHTFPEIC